MLKVKASIVLIVAIFIIGCASSSNSNEVKVSVSDKKCKEINRTDEYGYKLDNNHTYIFYKYNRANRTLYLNHYNIPFNCDKRGIGADISIKDNSIIVKEYHNLLEDGGERCMCLFDIYLKIDNIEPKEYSVDFINEAINDKISIDIDLINNPEGIKSFERTSYPYGQLVTNSNKPTIREIINDRFYNLDILPNNQTEVIKSKRDLERLILALREIGDDNTLKWADILEKEMDSIDFDKSYIVTYTFTKGCLYKYITTIGMRINTKGLEGETVKIELNRENEICNTVMTQYYLAYQIPNRFNRVQFIVDGSNPTTIYK